MSIEMKLELGHRASVRDKPTPEGFTHDWAVFVKGAEGTDIIHFVEKVVFYLHESFPKPRRVVKEPPYQVGESGYAGFMMPIEVYFRSKEEPKKVRFEYDLFLRLEGSPVYNIRREKLTFQNPSEEFRRKLLIARGVGSGTTVGNNAPSLQIIPNTPVQHNEESSRSSYSHAKQTPVPEKKIKSHSTVKESTKKMSLSGSKDSQKFTDPFGSSSNTNRHRNHKSKESHSSQSKSSKNLPPPPTVPPSNITPKEPKPSKTNHSPEVKEPKTKPVKTEKEPKSANKRSHPPEPQNHHGSTEKKRRHHSNSDVSEKNVDSAKVKDTKEKKEKHKNKTSGHNNKKEKHKSSHPHSSNKELCTKSSSKPVNNVKPSPSTQLSNEDDDDEDSNDKSFDKPFSKQSKDDSSPVSDLVNAADTWCEISPEKMDSTVDKDMISPMSPDSKHSPIQTSENLKNNNHVAEDSFDEKLRKPVKSEKSPKPKNAQKPKKPFTPINNPSNSNNITHNNVKQNGAVKEPLDHAYIRELMDLQQKIMALEDRNLLQKVVDVIQETGCYQMTTKSFDFDLCSLDQCTVRKLKHCLSL